MTTLDWPALAAEIKAARKVKGMRRQLDLAEAAGVSEATIGKLEAGGGKFQEVPHTLRQVSTALGWTPQSGADILHGGKPTPAAEAEAEGKPPQAPAPAEDLADGMPHLARQELKRGRVVDAEVADLSRPGSRSRLIVVWKRDDGEDEPITREEVEEWTRIQRAIRGLPTPEEE